MDTSNLALTLARLRGGLAPSLGDDLLCAGT